MRRGVAIIAPLFFGLFASLSDVPICRHNADISAARFAASSPKWL
jgi:hypothetical protein